MELKALSRLGWSVSALAREYGLSRTTVYKELASSAPRSYSRAKPTELNEAQLVHVQRRLSVCPGIRGTDLHAELSYEYGYEGSYPAFERHLRLLRPAEVKDPEIRFETGPGIQTQVDWAKLGLFPLGDRMVEGYRQHHMAVRPKLSRSPKEILYSQVYASFQHDETAVAAFEHMGYRNVMFGSDYPHMEGTFGHTQDTLKGLFDGISDETRLRITQGTFYELFPDVPPVPAETA